MSTESTETPTDQASEQDKEQDDSGQEQTSGRSRTRKRTRPSPDSQGDPAAPVAAEPTGGDNETAGDDETTGGEAAGRRRRRTRSSASASAAASASGEEVPDATAATDEGADAGGDVGESTSSDQDQPTRSRNRNRRRGRRGGRGGRGGGDRSTDAGPTTGVAEPASDDDTEDEQAADSGSTRVRSRSTSRSRGGRGRRSSGGRKPAGSVSEETRRAIADGPPRRMLVTVGDERTQVAVLEERNLVEHYVTRKSDVSYVGNIYLGRVQNVLPGMEAAFVDIGKGRNGVLYAGEVNYDEADLDEGLPRIEQTLKPGQSVLVQVTKDPMGSKGARLTQQLSIAGRYCVLAEGDGMLGISRKLPEDERQRLRAILADVKPEGFGLIVRTAAEDATQEQLEADVARLTRKWETVQERAGKAKPLEAVYEEPDLVIRVIRDAFGSEYTELIVDSVKLAEQIREYLGDVSPELLDRVTVYDGDDPLFDSYEVTTQIRRALEKKVWLASGGYLIVEKTEAMWVIDVNTGKFTGKDNLEETVLKNNLEAADEIARQLRLRDMGGIIVIDFVDMLVPANRDEVLKRFRRELARDKTKSRVMEISKLGLVQMTRKNVSQGVAESFTTHCETCEGRGRRILDEAF